MAELSAFPDEKGDKTLSCIFSDIRLLPLYLIKYLPSVPLAPARAPSSHPISNKRLLSALLDLEHARRHRGAIFIRIIVILKFCLVEISLKRKSDLPSFLSFAAVNPPTLLICS